MGEVTRYTLYVITLLTSLAIQSILFRLSVPWTVVLPVTLLLGILAYGILRYEPKVMESEDD